MTLLFGAAVLLLCGCSKTYVPDEGYSCTVTISLPDDGTVGEWIPVHAARTSGPWKIKNSGLPAGEHELPKPPPAREEEVADNLFWLVDPAEPARFDSLTMKQVRENRHGRRIMFTAPGVYKIHAITGYPTSATSVVHTITIKARP